MNRRSSFPRWHSIGRHAPVRLETFRSRPPTSDSSISGKERGQPFPRVSIISPKYRADKAVRSFLHQPCARIGLPFLLLANQAGLPHHATMASDGAIPDPLLPVATSAFATTHWSVVLAAREPDAPQAVEALE